MKTFITFSLIVLMAVFASSAQPKRSYKNSNLAVMLAYRPNSEIRTKDKTNNKTSTYTIDDEEKISEESVNDKLLSSLIKDRFAKRLRPETSGKTVKRENNNHDDTNEDTHGFESHESHEESVEADPAEIVEVSKENEKKICYKNTYKNVLNAFESALKNQIENYKKCVCQKKKNVTTTTEAATTVPSSTEPPRRQKLGLNGPAMASDENDVDDNQEVISSALEDKNNIVCFHKQHAFHLTKLLDLIPCQQSTDEPQPEIEEGNDEPVRRSERNNVQKFKESDSESVEIDVAQFTSKPKTTTLKPLRKSDDESDNLNQKILALLKDHFRSRKSRQETAAEKVHIKQSSPRKITIKAKAITKDEESEDKNASEESAGEFAGEEFVKQLQALFLKYKIGSDETFPMQSDEHFTESTSSMPLPKHAKKSHTVKNAVSESSDESTENSIKLKSGRSEKMRQQPKESSRKSSSNRSSTNANSIDNHQRKSYRSSPRTKANDDAVHPIETKNVSRNVNNNGKKSDSVAKSTRTSSNNRSSPDLAKKVSDFARGKSSSKKNQ